MLQFVFVLCQIQLLRKWDIRSINEMLTVEKATMSSNTPELCKWKLWQLHSCLVDADVVLLMFSFSMVFLIFHMAFHFILTWL